MSGLPLRRLGRLPVDDVRGQHLKIESLLKRYWQRVTASASVSDK